VATPRAEAPPELLGEEGSQQGPQEEYQSSM